MLQPRISIAMAFIATFFFALLCPPAPVTAQITPAVSASSAVSENKVPYPPTTLPGTGSSQQCRVCQRATVAATANRATVATQALKCNQATTCQTAATAKTLTDLDSALAEKITDDMLHPDLDDFLHNHIPQCMNSQFQKFFAYRTFKLVDKSTCTGKIPTPWLDVPRELYSACTVLTSGAAMAAATDIQVALFDGSGYDFSTYIFATDPPLYENLKNCIYGCDEKTAAAVTGRRRRHGGECDG